MCCAPELRAAAVLEIDTAPEEVVQSVTPSVVKQVWSRVHSAPAKPWWAASLPKGQSEDTILRQRYARIDYVYRACTAWGMLCMHCL